MYTIISLLLTIFILFAMGRVFWCGCGSLALWMSDAASSHTSQHLFDPYSFSHVQHGMFFFALLYVLKKPRLDLVIFLECIWEIIENSSFIIERYRTATVSLNYFGDSIGNSLGDILSCAIGFLICSRLTWRWSLGIYICIEVAMLLTIRDCLSLNVLMLLYPLEVIKTWQMS